MKKRWFIKILIILIIFCGCTNKQPLSQTQLLLDTQVTITLYDCASSNILDECFAICKDYELLFSRTNPKSELYQLNHQDKTKPIKISKELAKVINIGLEYSKLSNGTFDITVGQLIDLWDFKADTPKLPETSAIAGALTSIGYRGITLNDSTISFSNPNTIIDLGAVAKGYIADKIKEYLIEQGVDSAIINLGGNVLCVGKKNSDDFTIGITDPKGSSDILKLKINDQSVVTSGIYQRYFEVEGKYYHHILNPKTGYSYDNGLASVTIISNHSVDGDALSTVCFTLGKEQGLALVNQLAGIEAVFIDTNNALYYSDHAKVYVIQ